MSEWRMSPDAHTKEGWPEPGSHVLVALWPWKDGEPPCTWIGGFNWEGKDSWRPTFRGSDGDKIKPTPFAWMPLPDPPPLPSVEAGSTTKENT